MLTGIKDLDREILNYIPDNELSKVCSINKYFYYKVCDDAFLKRRLEKYNLSNLEAGKVFFFNVLHCIPRMRKMGFEYTKGNLKKQYILLRTYDCYYDSSFLIEAAREGELSLILHAFKLEKLRNFQYKYEEAVRRASENGHLEVVKFLLEQGADIHSSGNYPLRIACKNGHFDLVKFLIEHKADIHAYDGQALRWAKESGHLQIVSYLIDKGDVPKNKITSWNKL